MSEPESTGDITRLLQAVRQGDRAAEAEMLPLLYAELHGMAERYMRREREDHTLQATALVHEAYLRLMEQRRVDWQSRSHFLGVAAQTMRRVLIDHARGRARGKRSGSAHLLTLDEAMAGTGESAAALLELNEAIEQLAERAPRASRVVELLFFGGLSIDEAAEALGVADRTVDRDWQFAKAWLQAALSAAP